MRLFTTLFNVRACTSRKRKLVIIANLPQVTWCKFTMIAGSELLSTEFCFRTRIPAKVFPVYKQLIVLKFRFQVPRGMQKNYIDEARGRRARASKPDLCFLYCEITSSGILPTVYLLHVLLTCSLLKFRFQIHPSQKNKYSTN